MEHREDGLMVDFSGIDLQGNGQRAGNYPVVFAPKQEREMQTLDQETRLMRAMNEIRAYSPKNMNRLEREMFASMCEKIFEKHGIRPELYQQQFGHLGTPQNLRR